MNDLTNRHSIKDDNWHILNRTGMYLGSVVQTTIQEYLIINNEFKLYEVRYVPALVKMTNEIIDNSSDILKDMTSGKIDVIMNPYKNQIMVTDNGSGIPIKNIDNLDGSSILIPKACWSIAKSGSNFNDDEGDASTIGTNGVGSVCTNVLSKKFIGITNDGIKKYTGSWSNNASPDSYKESITDSKLPKGTSVYFEPDLERFGIENFDDGTCAVIKQRLINLSLTYPHITFTFNGNNVSLTKKEFILLLGDKGSIYNDISGKYSYAVYPSKSGDFESFSIVNGLNIKAGTHIDYILKYVVQSIKDKLPKKYSKVTTGEIKNKLNIVFLGRDFPKIEWSGQTKEDIGNSNKDIRAYLGEDWKNLLVEISKNKDIIDSITFLFSAKIDAENALAASEVDKEIKKTKVLKVRHASKIKKYLLLTEGDSALKGIIGALKRVDKGYLPLKGVVSNVFTNPIQSIIKNAEYKDIMNVLGLSFSKSNDVSKMLYEYVVITTDADVDGSHIKGLLLGFFYKFAPELFSKKKILILRTPIKVAKDKKENMIDAFITESDYKIFMKKEFDYYWSKKSNKKELFEQFKLEQEENAKFINPDSGSINSNKLKHEFLSFQYAKFLRTPSLHRYDIEYKKGLGSLNPKEYEQFFELKSFNKCLVDINYKEEDFELLINWLGEDADFRKGMIQKRISDFDIGNI